VYNFACDVYNSWQHPAMGRGARFALQNLLFAVTDYHSYTFPVAALH